MNLKSQTSNAAELMAELMYEIDSLYVSTEMILGRKFRKPPLDGLLLEVCLLHFRVIWDFFYMPPKKKTDLTVRKFIPKWTDIDKPARLEAIRKWLNVMLAHLTTHRTDPKYKVGEISETDITLIRDHTRSLFDAFVKVLTEDQCKALVNPLAHKFTQYETLKPELCAN
jgi:hypothetical protein